MSVASKSEQSTMSGQSPVRSVVEALRGLWFLAQKIFFRVIQPNRTYYYTCYYGTNNALMLFFKNLVRPKSFLTKFVYGQVIPLPMVLLKCDPAPAFTPFPQALEIAEKFKRDGIVVVPGLFPDIADHMRAKYDMNFEQFKPADSYQDCKYLKQIDQKFLYYMVDEMVMQVFALYFGCQPYLRSPVASSLAFPPFAMKSTRETEMAGQGFAMGWHYDTPNLAQIALLINDVTESDTHMQIVKGDHKIHKINLGKYDYYYSEEYVRDHCEVVPCIGPKGTAYFFDPNALHRLMVVKDSPRYMVKTEIMPGNDILPVKHPHIDYRISVEGGLNLDGFTLLQKNALRHLI